MNTLSLVLVTLLNYVFIHVANSAPSLPITSGVFSDDYLQSNTASNGWYIYDDVTGSKGNPLINSGSTGITYHGPTKRDTNQGYYQRKFMCPTYSKVRWTADIAYCSPSSSTSNTVQTFFNGQSYGNQNGWVLMGTGIPYIDTALATAASCNNWEHKQLIEPNCDADSGVAPRINAMEEFDFKFKFRLIGSDDYAVVWNFTLFCDPLMTPTPTIVGQSTIVSNGVFYDDYLQNDGGINGWYIYDDVTGNKGNPLVNSCDTGITYHGPTKRDTNQGYYQRKFRCPSYSSVRWTADVAYCSPSSSTSNTVQTFFNGQSYGNQNGWVRMGTGIPYNDPALATAANCNIWEYKQIVEPNGDVDSGIAPIVNPMEEFDFKFKFRLIGDGDYAVVSNFRLFCDQIPTKAPTPAPTNNPTPAPTDGPTPAPTINPTTDPTKDPTADPTKDPTKDPTTDPTTSQPTTTPTTSEPTTSNPTTSVPTTSEPTTSDPTTSKPTTSEPTKAEITTTVTVIAETTKTADAATTTTKGVNVFADAATTRNQNKTMFLPIFLIFVVYFV